MLSAFVGAAKPVTVTPRAVGKPVSLNRVGEGGLGARAFGGSLEGLAGGRNGSGRLASAARAAPTDAPALGRPPIAVRPREGSRHILYLIVAFYTELRQA